MEEENYTRADMDDAYRTYEKSIMLKIRDNFEKDLLIATKRALDNYQNLKESKDNLKTTKEILRLFKDNEEIDARRIFSQAKENVDTSMKRYSDSVIELMDIAMFFSNSKLYDRELRSLGKSDYFDIEDMEFVNELIKLLSQYDSAYIKFEMVIKALDTSIEDFVHCKNNNIVFEDEFPKNFPYVFVHDDYEDEEGDYE